MTIERPGVLLSERKGIDPAEVEEWGYHSLWCTEGTDATSFPRLQRWASRTDSLRLGTGIVNIFSRSPATLAMETISLDRFSNGRAMLGLGTSHEGIIRGVHGIAYDKPVSRMKEYLQLLRRYLSGEGGPFDGDFFQVRDTGGFREGFEPVNPDIPLYNAAVGPRNIRLTGAWADGWYPIHYPPHLIKRGQELLAEGAERRGRNPDEIDVALVLLAAVHEDRQTARSVILRELAYYTNHEIYYERLGRDAGFEEDVKRLHEAQPDVDSVAGDISDEFLDAVSLFGTPSEAREKLMDVCRETGLDQPIIFLPRGADRSMARQTVEALSPAGME